MYDFGSHLDLGGLKCVCYDFGSHLDLGGLVSPVV